jgi:hypothetical protein
MVRIREKPIQNLKGELNTGSLGKMHIEIFVITLKLGFLNM